MGLGAATVATTGVVESIGAFMIAKVTPMQMSTRAMPLSQSQRVMGETGSLWLPGS